MFPSCSYSQMKLHYSICNSITYSSKTHSGPFSVADEKDLVCRACVRVCVCWCVCVFQDLGLDSLL